MPAQVRQRERVEVLHGVFDWCPLAALVDGTVLCVHGGLSPDVRTIDQMRMIDRKMEIPHEGAFCDLMWSDPDDIDTWAVSPTRRGLAVSRQVRTVTSEFNSRSKGSVLICACTHSWCSSIRGELICRAHHVQRGLQVPLVGRSGRRPTTATDAAMVAAILQLDEQLGRNFKIFREVDNLEPPSGGRGNLPYFL